MAVLTLLAPASLQAKPETRADCDAIHTGPCSRRAGERTVTLEIDPKPVRHMSELTFRIRIEPCPGIPSTLMLDLGMPGMVMGKNQVRMIRDGSCTWSGRGIIVRCMSGRRLWRATLMSPELGNPAFTFNVRD